VVVVRLPGRGLGGSAPPAGRAARGAAVEVLEPRELELPEVGLLTLVDPETGAAREVQTASRKLRRRYAEAMTAHRDQTHRRCGTAGAAHLVLRTDTDWVRDVAAFATARRRGRASGGTRPGGPVSDEIRATTVALLLVLVAALVAAYLVAQRRRPSTPYGFATLPMLERVAPKRPGGAGTRRPWPSRGADRAGDRDRSPGRRIGSAERATVLIAMRTSQLSRMGGERMWTAEPVPRSAKQAAVEFSSQVPMSGEVQGRGLGVVSPVRERLPWATP
jgi:hypothetical protein